MDLRQSLSLIVPLSACEELGEQIAIAASHFTWVSEVIYVSPSQERLDKMRSTLNACLPEFSNRCRFLVSAPGREKQMNSAARIATGNTLAFVHADSALEKEHLERLFDALGTSHANSIFSYWLNYKGLLSINAFFANLRSRILKLPFGDQAFVLSKKFFLDNQGFCEILGDGAEILWLQKMKRRRARIQILPYFLSSSTRRYTQRGWWNITRQHLCRTWKLLKIDRKYYTGSKKPSAPTNSALVVFVKTPQLSPLKTRLSKELGDQHSLTFYRKSLEALRALMKTLPSTARTTCFWAVAEEKGVEDPLWQDYQRIYQGEGILGERLAQVERELRSNDFRSVVFLGADAPQIPESWLKEALRFLAEDHFPRHCFGPCPDGGFYLFGSNYAVDESAWKNTPYSQKDTLEFFKTQLNDAALTLELPTLTDVDYRSDLKTLCEEWPKEAQLPEQLKVKQWVEDL